PHGPAVGGRGGLTDWSSSQLRCAGGQRGDGGCPCHRRAGRSAVVAGGGRPVGAGPAPACGLGSGMGGCRPPVDLALAVTRPALMTGHGTTRGAACREAALTTCHVTTEAPRGPAA